MKGLIALLIVVALAGCSTYNRVTVHNDTKLLNTQYQTTPPLEVGDKIKYTLKNGSSGEMVFQLIRNNVMNGNNGAKVPLDQVVKLERKEISKGKTAAAVGAGVSATAIIFITIVSVGLAGALIAAGG